MIIFLRLKSSQIIFDLFQNAAARLSKVIREIVVFSDKPIEGAQMWNTTIEEDEIAWNIADRYFEQSYSITSHNCYQLGTTVLRGLNSRRRELKYKASQVWRPNTAFLNNIYYKYAVEVDQETGIPTGRDIDAEWDKINQTLDLLYL